MKYSIALGVTALSLALATGSVMGAKPKPKAPAKAAAGNVKNGAAVFAKRFPVECKACHKFKNQGSTALGTDLTHAGKKMNAAKLKAVMQNPKKFNPKSIMPPVKWSDKELTDVAAFLATQK
ncbi:MAG: cytochrome c [Armatimonadetes bacterium]|nr:cytochrome c [Armatimonadota bacterium]